MLPQMSLNKLSECCSSKVSLKISTTTNSKRLKIIFILAAIVCLICLLLWFFELPLSVLRLQVITTVGGECHFDERVIRRVKHPFNGIAIEVSCPFLDRVRVFNAALDHLRLEHLNRRRSKEWRNISALKNIKLIGGAEDDFLQQLENFSQIETVFLPWTHNKARIWNSLEDTSNVLVNKYFEWTTDTELCQYIKNSGVGRYSHHIMYNGTCVTDIQKTKKPQSLHLLALNSKPLWLAFYWPNNGTSYPPHFYHEPPPFVFYLHMIQDCIVTEESEVWSGNMHLVQHTCSYNINKGPPQNIDKIPLYDEVIAVSQLWGFETYHRMIEVIPRLSLYIDFLRRNPQIKILAADKHGRTTELLAILGLSNHSIITGVCRARLLYLPRPTMCIFANIQEIQVLSLQYRNYINKNFKTEQRNKIILIRRSRHRKFAQHDEIERMVKETAAAYNLSFALFPDNPVPSLNKTMIMFHSAVMVIAPHGAGLANVVFSQPGTFIIEGVCNAPYVNLCFQRLSNVLGHHWHGLYSLGGCKPVVNISASTLKDTVEKHLNIFKEIVAESRHIGE